MAELTAEAIAAAIEKSQRKTAPGAGLGSSTEVLKGAFEKVTGSMGAVAQVAKDNVDTFQKLSSTGSSFNNDMVGMRVAAANSRVSIDEFSEIITANNKNFSGLGGNVAKGSQVFAQFSQTFFDSGVVENLRQMGFTSKDLNEVLATQIGFQKSTTDTSVEGQIRTSRAAAELATELDQIAKLTGKSRKEQEESLKKAQQDGQVEAKFRLIGIQQGAEAEKTARENYAKQLAQAQAMGTGQLFKEMFATGTAQTKEARMQMGLLGGAARDSANSAKALAQGNSAASQQFMETAKAANMENQKNVALLKVAAIGIGDAGAVMKKNIETNDAAFHGLVKTQKAAEAMGVQLNSTTEALKLQKDAIKEEQNARHGVTQATIAVTNRLQDAEAALYNKLIVPMNQRVAPEAAGVAQKLSQGVGAEATAAETAGQYERMKRLQATEGGAASSREKIESGLQKFGVEKAGTMMGVAGAGAISGADNFVTQAARFGSAVFDRVQIGTMSPSRDEGTLGKTGQPFEPETFIGQIEKGEMVLTPEQAKNFLSGARSEGLQASVQEMSKSFKNFDLSKINESFNTSVSQMQSMIPSMKKDSLSIKTPQDAASQILDRTNIKMPSMNELSIGPDGMPRVVAKQQAAEIPKSIDQKRADDAKKAQAPAAETTPAAETRPVAGATASADTKATLDDVVKSLNSLNIVMNKLYSASETTNNLVERQVKATKAMSGNLHGSF